jgi:hypothetical protein
MTQFTKWVKAGGSPPPLSVAELWSELRAMREKLKAARALNADMLAALQSILEDGGRVSLDVRENLMVWSGDLGALSKAREAARTAIAKATGGEA